VTGPPEKQPAPDRPGPAGRPELGAFARMWKRDSAAEIAAAMAAEGLTTAQWNFSALGQPTVSDRRTAGDYTAVRTALGAHGLSVWGLSCTFNLLDPDPVRRAELTGAAVAMIALAPAIGATAVTVCTGSRAPDGWTYHPDNGTAAAWREMSEGLGRLMDAAADAGVLIGMEPERGCVVAGTASCARLLAEAGPDALLGVVLDAWNLAAGDPARPAAEVVAEAFELLGPRTVCLQAKDPLGRKFRHGPKIDYAQVARLHAAHCPGAPVVLQDVAEPDVGEAVAALRSAWAAAGDAPPGTGRNAG
jgi:sugar phosphate isomerase/epimerase